MHDNRKTNSPSGHMDAWRFNLGDVVYLKVRDENLRGMVTGINIRPASVVYEVTWASSTSYHYEFELSTEYTETYDVP